MVYKDLKNISFRSAILLILNFAVIAFIFVHSMSPSVESAEESGTVMDFLNFIFPFQLSDHIVRKMAHFIEFAALGFVTTLTVYSFFKKYFGGIFLKLFVCLGTAVIDEAIQLNVEGRSGQISDVILDFSGAVFGIVLSTFLVFIINKIRKRGKKINGKC